MNTINVKTAPGTFQRLPSGAVVTETGAIVEKDTFVRRRLRDGSLIEVKPTRKKESD